MTKCYPLIQQLLLKAKGCRTLKIKQPGKRLENPQDKSHDKLAQLYDGATALLASRVLELSMLCPSCPFLSLVGRLLLLAPTWGARELLRSVGVPFMVALPRAPSLMLLLAA